MKLSKSYIRRSALNRHPKATLLSLSAVLFTLGLVTSVATTYAWYSLNVLLSVPNLNVRIRSAFDDALQLTLVQKDGNLIYGYDGQGDDEARIDDAHKDEENGSFTGFTLADMGYDSSNGLNDVSGANESLWNNGVYGNTVVPRFQSHPMDPEKTEDGFAPEKRYIQATFLLSTLAEDENYDIYLSPESLVSIPSVEQMPDPDQRAKAAKAIKTIRVSFYSESVADIEDGKAALYEIAYQPEVAVDDFTTDDLRTTYYGGILDLNGDGYYDYSIKDGKPRETLYGDYTVNGDEGSIYTKDIKATGKGKYGDESSGVFDGKHQEFDDIEYVDLNNENLVIATEDSHPIYEYQYDETKPLKPLRPVCSLHNNTYKNPKRLVLSIYCEGWDRDMTDDIDKASFNINLGFIAVLK